MPGYSGTPLPKKLGIKEGFRVSLIDAPSEVMDELKLSLEQCEIVRNAKHPIDFVMVFTKSGKVLQKEFHRASKNLSPAGMIWVCWPKKSSGVVAEVDETFAREIGLSAGLVDIKVCAITNVWSGLKFVRRLKDR